MLKEVEKPMVAMTNACTHYQDALVVVTAGKEGGGDMVVPGNDCSGGFSTDDGLTARYLGRSDVLRLSKVVFAIGEKGVTLTF